jgi:D-beta-D-heptose 7-phosphate kinase/D-beta-D-heptose 1-phosphate adenosyltransferase
VACNISALGGVPHLVSVVGQDAEGDRLLSLLRDKNIDVEGVVKDDSRPTILKTRVMAGPQQVVRFDHESQQPFHSEINKTLLRRIESILPNVKGIIISDYGKGLINPQLLPAILALARRHKKIVTVDPKIEHFFRYRGVHCITPNLKEAIEGTRSLPPKTDAEVDALGRKILKRLRCRTVLITRGERGMSLYDASGKITHIPAQALEVFDVTGAGDTVISTFTLALASGASYIEAAQLSNLAGGVVVAKLGTATAKPAEIRAALAHWHK